MSQGSYANWENGKREPSLENVVRLAKLFGVTTDYLLGRYK
ncbi:helix-turn-helix domain-containing protein [Streptococcus pluranimalium]